MSGPFVRVVLGNGLAVTIGRAFAEARNLKVLDEPAVNSWGRPLPTTRKAGRRKKPRTTVHQEAAKKATSPGTTTTGGAAAARSEEGTE